MTYSADSDAQRLIIERALKVALASGELSWVDPSLNDEERSDARIRELSELGLSLQGLEGAETPVEADQNPILHIEPAQAEVRTAQVWGIDSAAPDMTEGDAEKPKFLSSRFQQIALTDVCVVLILAAAAFAGAQLIFAAIDAGTRPQPIGIVLQDRPEERVTLMGDRGASVRFR